MRLRLSIASSRRFPAAVLLCLALPTLAEAAPSVREAEVERAEIAYEVFTDLYPHGDSSAGPYWSLAHVPILAAHIYIGGRSGRAGVLPGVAGSLASLSGLLGYAVDEDLALRNKLHFWTLVLGHGVAFAGNAFYRDVDGGGRDSIEAHLDVGSFGFGLGLVGASATGILIDLVRSTCSVAAYQRAASTAGAEGGTARGFEDCVRAAEARRRLDWLVSLPLFAGGLTALANARVTPHDIDRNAGLVLGSASLVGAAIVLGLSLLPDKLDWAYLRALDGAGLELGPAIVPGGGGLSVGMRF